MQTVSRLKTGPSPWQEELARSFRNIDQLLDYLQLDKDQRQPKPATDIQFPFRVTPAFAGKMRKGDMNDPLLRQVLPLTEEMKDQPGFSQNPVGDLEARATRGVLHKYRNRILLLETEVLPERPCRQFPMVETGYWLVRLPISVTSLPGGVTGGSPQRGPRPM